MSELMPGIVGLITKRPREWAEPQLARMVQALLHESFYETGTWIDESLGVYAGGLRGRILLPTECQSVTSGAMWSSFFQEKIIPSRALLAG